MCVYTCSGMYVHASQLDYNNSDRCCVAATDDGDNDADVMEYHSPGIIRPAVRSQESEQHTIVHIMAT